MKSPLRRILASLFPLLAPLALAAAPIDDLDWLAGHWRGTVSEGTALESHYTTPEGGLVVGSSKEFKDGRCVSFDVEVFGEKDGQLLLMPHPNGQRSKHAFPLAALDKAARKATFVNRQHDWPQVFVYQRIDDDHLLIVLSGPGRDGKEAKIEYAFTRIK